MTPVTAVARIRSGNLCFDFIQALPQQRLWHFTPTAWQALFWMDLDSFLGIRRTIKRLVLRRCSHIMENARFSRESAIYLHPWCAYRDRLFQNSFHVGLSR